MLSMVKITVRALVLLFLATLIITSPIHAQDDEKTEHEKKLEELNFKLEEYNKVREEYILKRAQYLTFKTLTAQEEAYSATYKFLQIRDDVVIIYLEGQKAKISEANDVTDEAKSTLTIKIDVELEFFRNHKETIPSAGTLQDLVNDSNKAKTEFAKIDPLTYEISARISDGKVKKFDERSEELLGRRLSRAPRPSARALSQAPVAGGHVNAAPQ